MKTLRWLPVLVAAASLFGARPAEAIQGCTLKDPDRDIRRLFPESTDYRSHFISLDEHGGPEALDWLARRLGDELDPVYEAADLPYAYYEVLRGTDVIGFVFGVNQKGKYGGMQVILATDTQGTIRELYYQKLTSLKASLFRRPTFTAQFKGLNLADFYFHRGYREMGVKRPEDRVAGLRAPGESGAVIQDYRATLRGVAKALVLFDRFWGKGRFEPVFEKVRSTVNKAQREGRKTT